MGLVNKTFPIWLSTDSFDFVVFLGNDHRSMKKPAKKKRKKKCLKLSVVTGTPSVKRSNFSSWKMINFLIVLANPVVPYTGKFAPLLCFGAHPSAGPLNAYPHPLLRQTWPVWFPRLWLFQEKQSILPKGAAGNKGLHASIWRPLSPPPQPPHWRRCPSLYRCRGGHFMTQTDCWESVATSNVGVCAKSWESTFLKWSIL